MKKIIITSLLLLAFITLRDPVETQAATYSDALRAYHELLSEAVDKHGIIKDGVDHLEWGNADISVCYAELIDFDNDGAPELVYTCGLASEHGVGDDCYVYGYPGKLELYYSSYSGGTDDHAQRIRLLKSSDGKTYMLRERNDVVGLKDREYFTVIDGKWVSVLRRQAFPTLADDRNAPEYKWQVNGKDVNEREYDTASDKLGIINTREVPGSPASVRAVLSELDIKAIKVFLNNKAIAFDQPPIIENGRTLVPVRAIAEAMGAKVDWVAESQTVVITKGRQVIKMQINNLVMTIDGAAMRLDVPPKIVGGRALIPVRAVSEAFGAKVDWIAAEYAVYINY